MSAKTSLTLPFLLATIMMITHVVADNGNCPPNEVWQQCATSCQPVCQGPITCPAKPPCGKSAYGSCVCKTGYVRPRPGEACIPKDKCNVCSNNKHEIWSANALQVLEQLCESWNNCGKPQQCNPPTSTSSSPLIGLIVDGLDISDNGTNAKTSDYGRIREAAGYCSCQPQQQQHLLTKIYYKGQPTSSNSEVEAMRVLCYSSGIINFCACTEDGQCFQYMEKGPFPTYVELGPYCDKNEGCHVYMEAFYRLRAVDNLGRPTGYIQETKLNAGPFGYGSSYLKILSVSCNGCQRIRPAQNDSSTCPGPFVVDTAKAAKFPSL